MRAAALAVWLALASWAYAQESRVATLYAERIYCDACAAVITKALRGVPGVGKASVDVEKKEVLVHFDPAKASVEDLTAATARKGFPSTVRKVQP
jgi:copper chaperone CopZ